MVSKDDHEIEDLQVEVAGLLLDHVYAPLLTSTYGESCPPRRGPRLSGSPSATGASARRPG